MFLFRPAHMTTPADQTETAAYLRGLAGADPIETHISLVFLGPDTVWKLKKSVHLSFLDFTTVEARRHFCERELALNAQAAPGLYRDIVPIRRQPDGTLVLGAPAPSPNAVGGPPEPVLGRASPTRGLTTTEKDGPIVDWVLRMARVPAAGFLTAIVAENRLDPSLLDAIADAVAAYHQALPPLPHARPDMRWIAAGNVRSALDAGLPPDTVHAWGKAMAKALDALSPWLEQRAANGFVRRAHGDLHLGNLCLWNGKPALFDALEFDEDLATIDLGYDLAFLLMDLEHRVGRPAANRVLNRYVARTGDAALVKALPAFLSMRAMVRAHVAARSGQAEAAQSYLASATAYLRPARPVVVAVGGLPGSGKSTLARALAPDLGPSPGALVVRSDEIRKRLFGSAPEQRLPQAAYTPQISRQVFEILAAHVQEAAAAGHAAVADARFMSAKHRALVTEAAGKTGVPFIGLWLQAPMKELERRVAARTGDASDATVAVLRAAAPHDPGPVDWTPIDASDANAALARARNFLPLSSEPC